MIIKMKQSIIPALDVDSLEKCEEVVKATASLDGIGAYKIGFELVILFGMKQTVDVIRKHSGKPIIYDHQKAGTDVPFTGERFASACKKAGCDAVILFPQAGPETEKAWIKACTEAGLGVIVGGEMTHPGYLKSDGGFLCDDSPKRMYEVAADNGVVDFVVPGNKPDKIAEYKEFLEAKGIFPVFYSPGLITQGGDIAQGAKAAGKSWHAIVGRALVGAEDVETAARELVKGLT